MQSLITNLCPLLDWLKGKGRVRKVTPKGKHIIFATDIKLSHSFGFRGEGDAVPASGNMTNVQGSVLYQKGIRGMIGLTFESMKFGRQGPGSFTTVETQEMKGAAIMMRKMAQVAAWGWGHGELGRVNAVVATDAMVTQVSETYNTCHPGARWLIEGMKIIGADNNAANYAIDSAWTAANIIESINSDISVTMTDSFSCDADAYLLEHQCPDTAVAANKTLGSVTLDTTNSFRGPQGMMAMCDNETMVTSYCGINAAAGNYPQWKAVVDHNSGTARALTLDLFYSLYYKLSRKRGQFKIPLTAWMNTDVYRELVQLLEHFVDFKPRNLQPGFDEFDVMIQGTRIPIKLDHECPSFIFFLDPQFITWAEGQALQLAREGGSIWRWDVDRKDQFEAMYRWLWQTYTRSRNKHGIIKDIDVTIRSM